MDEIKVMLIILQISVIAIMIVGMALLHRKMEKVFLEVDWLVDDADKLRLSVKDVFDKVEALPNEIVGAAAEKPAQDEDDEDDD